MLKQMCSFLAKYLIACKKSFEWIKDFSFVTFKLGTLAMKLIIFIIVSMIQQVYNINGIIWHNKNESFVPIFSVEPFKTMHDRILRCSKEIENHKFQGDNLYFLYFNDKDVFKFFDNDKKATGVSGDIWTMMSEYLNFTMILNKTDIRTLGSRYDPKGNYTGILGLMQQGNYTIIPRMEAFGPRLEVVDFTNAFWKEHSRIFIKPYYKFKVSWMLHLFSERIWILIIIFYLFLSILSIVSQKITGNSYSHELMSSPKDHFFYVFGALCNQGDVLYIAQKNSKILSFSISMFSWMLMTSFSSQLIIYVTQTVLIQPFEDLETLLDTTDYTILAEKNSVTYIAFTKNYTPAYVRVNEAKRIHFYSSYNHMWDLTCNDKEKYAVFQSNHMKTDSIAFCPLYPIGPKFFKTWIVAGIAKNFPYKKTINNAIIKFHEHGIIKVLMGRWLRVSSADDEEVTKFFTPITLHQVVLLVCVYLFGLGMSIVIVIIERIIYVYAMKQKLK